MVEVGIWIAGAIAGYAVGRLISDRQHQATIADIIRQSDNLMFAPRRQS
jgi:hypothetical protein